MAHGQPVSDRGSGIANLAIGALGILCYWIRGNFWTATVIATSIWLFSAVTIHVKEMVEASSYNPGNVGIVFYMDIIGPLLLIPLLIYTSSYRSTGKHEPASMKRP